MNFVVIEGSLEGTKEKLEADRKLLKKVLLDTRKEEYKTKLALIEGKLKAINRYEYLQSKKSEFNKIHKVKHTNPELYIEKCKELCKDIKGMTFSIRDMRFIVRPTIDGKKVYIGAFDDLEEAIEGTEMYYTNLNKFR